MEPYNALQDKYLRNYFNNQLVRDQLFRTGLTHPTREPIRKSAQATSKNKSLGPKQITRNGRILSEHEQKKVQITRARRKALEDMLLKEIDFLTQQYHRKCQLELQKRLDTVQKLENKMKVLGDRLVPYDDYDEQFLTRAAEMVPGTSAEQADADMQMTGEGPMPAVYRQKMLRRLDSVALRAHKSYLARQLDEIRAASQYLQRSRSLPPHSRGSSTNSRMRPISYGMPYPYGIGVPVYGVPPWVGARSANMASYSAQNGNNFVEGERANYSEAEEHGHISRSLPDPDQRSRSVISRSRPATKTLYNIRSKSSNPYKGSFRVHAKCEIFLLHQGKDTTKMCLQQQHCGGGSVTLFNGSLQPLEELKVMSWRHVGYPFALVITMDDVSLFRVNVCCESRLPPRKPLDGSKRDLLWLGVRNAVPCYKCHIRRKMPTPYSNYKPANIVQDVTDLEVENGRSSSIAAIPDQAPNNAQRDQPSAATLTNGSPAEKASTEDGEERNAKPQLQESSDVDKTADSSTSSSDSDSSTSSDSSVDSDNSESTEKTMTKAEKDSEDAKSVPVVKPDVVTAKATEIESSDSEEGGIRKSIHPQNEDLKDNDNKLESSGLSVVLDEKPSEAKTDSGESGVAATQESEDNTELDKNRPSSSLANTVGSTLPSTTKVDAEVHQTAESSRKKDDSPIGSVRSEKSYNSSVSRPPTDSDAEEKDIINRLRLATSQLLAESNQPSNNNAEL